jgi:esterase
MTAVPPLRMLELPAGRLAYWDVGNGASSLFVHGAGTSGEIWVGDLAELARDGRLIVYDRRGYGASSESPRDWRAHREDAAALIEALEAAPAQVVGYSGGSIVALDLALERPELVASLVLVDPAFNVRRCVTPGLLRALWTTRLLRRARGDRAAAEHWLRFISGYPIGGSAFDRISPERRELLLRNAGGLFADLASVGGAHVDESHLRDLEVPVTIIEAGLSPSFLRRSARRLRRLIPQARVVMLEQSGHHVGVDARDELLATLRGAVTGA